MAGRQTKTPGVETPKETTTAAQADAALEEILGTPGVKDAEPTQNDSEVAADVLVPVEQFDAVAQQLADAQAKLAAYEKQSKAVSKTAAAAPAAQNAVGTNASAGSVRRTREVLTEFGWSKEEY